MTPAATETASTIEPPRARAPRFGRFLMQVLWPAFLVSALAEGIFFSMVDPHELTIVGVHLADSREAAYTVGFFVFWVLLSLSSGLTWWLASDERHTL